MPLGFTGGRNGFVGFGPGGFGSGRRVRFGAAAAFGTGRVELRIGQAAAAAAATAIVALSASLSTAAPAAATATAAAISATIPVSAVAIALAAFDSGGGHQVLRGGRCGSGGFDGRRIAFDDGLGAFGVFGRGLASLGGSSGRNHHDGGAAIELQNLFFDAGDDLVVLVVVFEEIGNIKEGVAVQADIDKGRLHARQHAGDSSFVDAAGERVFVLALMVNFSY